MSLQETLSIYIGICGIVESLFKRHLLYKLNYFGILKSLQKTSLTLKSNSRDIQNCQIVKSVSSRDTFNVYWILWNCGSLFKRHL